MNSAFGGGMLMERFGVLIVRLLFWSRSGRVKVDVVSREDIDRECNKMSEDAVACI